MRILSMDVGDKRIGMAISDALGWTAQGIDTLVGVTISMTLNIFRKYWTGTSLKRLLSGFLRT